MADFERGRALQAKVMERIERFRAGDRLEHDAVARAMGCQVVLSEDLNAGQDYDGVVVQNPFC